MATIAFCCGGELTTDPSTSSHWTSVSNAVTQDATHVRSGSFALKVAAAGASCNVRKVIAAGNRHVIVRFSLYMPSVPAFNFTRLVETSISGRNVYMMTNGKLQLYDVQSTNVLPLAQWVDIDVEYDTSANPHTYDWRINGVAQPGTSAATAAADITSLYFGTTNAGPTADWWYDDIAYSLTDGDYPIPNGSVSGTVTEVWTNLVVTGTGAGTQAAATASGTGTVVEAVAPSHGHGAPLGAARVIGPAGDRTPRKVRIKGKGGGEQAAASAYGTGFVNDDDLVLLALDAA